MPMEQWMAARRTWPLLLLLRWRLPTATAQGA